MCIRDRCTTAALLGLADDLLRGVALGSVNGDGCAVTLPSRHHSELETSPEPGVELVVAGGLARHGGQHAGALRGL